MENQTMLDNLNTASEKLFSSIQGEVYEILDKIVCISSDLFKEEPLSIILNENNIQIISAVAKSVALIYVLQYVITKFIDMYNGEIGENIFSFVIKLTLTYIFISYSYDICMAVINFFTILSDTINDFVLKFSRKRGKLC